MDAPFLTCCLKGLEATRHFTPAIGESILIMLAVAVLVAGLLLIVLPIVHSRQSG